MVLWLIVGVRNDHHTMETHLASATISRLFLIFMLAGLFGCSEQQQQSTWHDEKLASGRMVKVTSCLLAWGVEHDERTVDNDCFALEFVSALPSATAQEREAEAREAFELIRPPSEVWGLRTATVASFPSLLRKGHYNFYIFEHQTNGSWSVKSEDRKVFSTD